MEALNKFLNLKHDENIDQPSKRQTFSNEFRKPVWFDDCESDDELSERKGFQIFTNPLEMERYFQQQMQELLKSFDHFDESEKIFSDENVREKFLKPGFDLYKENMPVDTDLDDEIYADQLHTLLQRLSPELEEASSNMKTHVETNKNVKKTDEETIWDRIHGTIVDKNKPNPPKRNQQLFKKLPHPRGGVFEGAFQGPKVFRQSVMTQVIRKPDGSSETRRTVRDADGNENTTITKRTNEGKVETFTFSGNGQQVERPMVDGNHVSALLPCDRNVFVTKEGYTIPKLW